VLFLKLLTMDKTKIKAEIELLLVSELSDNNSTFYQFEKKGILFEKPKDMPNPGPYYPCLVKMDKINLRKSY